MIFPLKFNMIKMDVYTSYSNGRNEQFALIRFRATTGVDADYNFSYSISNPHLAPFFTLFPPGWEQMSRIARELLFYGIFHI